MDILERDALEVLCLVRFLKNSFAPINRIPPEVLSLIPDHYNTDYADRGLITLTHVCRGWREIFISHSSLWTHLNLTNIEKTRAYIQRSKSSPLNIRVENRGSEIYLNHTLPLVIPHVPRLKSFVVHAAAIPHILRHFRCHAPLLERLDIGNTSPHAQILDNALFDGDLSPLRDLSLVGVVTNLPWTNMANLTGFMLFCPPGHEVTVTRLLDFFESAPLLHTLNLINSTPNSSDASPKRIVPLHNLNTLSYSGVSAHPILTHLYIPTGASLNVWTTFGGQSSPLLDYLLEPPPNFKNLSHITTLNFCFESKRAQLIGPNGSLRLSLDWDDQVITSSNMGHRTLRSLGPQLLSTTRQLTISGYVHRSPANVGECPLLLTLSYVNNLRTLVLSECKIKPFISALNPERHLSKLVLCPSLKEIVVYRELWYNTKDLVSMSRGRALRGAKLSCITMIGSGIPLPETEISGLREHVTHVEYRTEIGPLTWDYLSDESGSRFGE